MNSNKTNNSYSKETINFRLWKHKEKTNFMTWLWNQESSNDINIIAMKLKCNMGFFEGKNELKQKTAN